MIKVSFQSFPRSAELEIHNLALLSLYIEFHEFHQHKLEALEIFMLTLLS